MNGIPFHPALVHLPIGLGVILPLVDVFLAYGLWRAWFDRRVWLVAVGLHALVALGAGVAVNTGDHEGERVEHRVPADALEAHEELGETTLGFAIGALVLAAAAGALKPGSMHKAALALTCVGSIATAGLALATGKKGGELVYLHGAASQPGAQQPQLQPAQHERDEDVD